MLPDYVVVAPGASAVRQAAGIAAQAAAGADKSGVHTC